MLARFYSMISKQLFGSIIVMNKLSVKIILYISVILVVLSVSATMCISDEILFKNGELLIGTVERMENGKIVFKSQLAGEVVVDLAQVERLTTKSIMKFHLSDGSIVRSSDIKANETGLTIKSSGVESIALSNIKALTRV